MNSVKESLLKENIKYLHIVRGFAAFLVVLFHSKWPFWIGGSAFFARHRFSDLSLIDKLGVALAMISGNGTAMVIVFFVLSGFMISYSYTKNSWTYKDFLINRALRIYIPYIMSALLAGLALYMAWRLSAGFFLKNFADDYNANVIDAYKNLTIKNFMASLLFYHTGGNYFGFNNAYWSLLYEMIFYLFFPVILNNSKQVFIISLVLHPLHFFFKFDQQSYFYLYFFTQYLLYFSSGVMLFQWLQNPKNLFRTDFFLSRRVLNISLWGLFLVGIVGVGLATNRGSVSFLFSVLFACVWIYRLIRYGTRVEWLTNIFMFLGRISYSLYLIHLPILLFFYALLNKANVVPEFESPWIYLFFAFLTLPFSFIFYSVFEELSMKLIEKHKKRIKAQKLQLQVPVNDLPFKVSPEK
jgi:peptidoglycan/LPS O-acetylase OafA/YrhL